MTGKNTPKKVDREEIFFEITRSLCPVCKKVIDADVLLKDGKVYMHKFCTEHGWFDSLIYSDADLYTSNLKYNKPGTLPLHFASEIKKGCPEDCGLCPEHQQHTCLGIIEITDACNLSCPVCLADAKGNNFLSLEQVSDMLDLYVKAESNPDVLQISGGEPTLHPQLLEILILTKLKGINVVQLNTNGLRIAQDDLFIEDLAKVKPAVYLQFDGFTPEIYQKTRGADLLDIKMNAIERLTEKGISIVLSVTVVKGVNDHQVGEITRFAIEHPGIRGVFFQPVGYIGRFDQPNPMDRTTIPDVLKGIETQTNGWLNLTDFIPVPCPYPTCMSVTYVHYDGAEVKPLPRVVNVDEYLDYVQNRIVSSLSPITQESLEGLWSASATPGSNKNSNDYACACGVPLDIFKGIEKEITMIGIHAFMDVYNFDLKRARKCCIHQILPEGKMVPFCVYNNLKRGC